MKFPLFKQSDGKPSASFTMMMIGFVICSLWLLASIVENIAGVPIREFNGAEAMAYFTPLAMLYFGRRWTSEMGQNAANSLIKAVKGSGTNSVSPPPPDGTTESEDPEKPEEK